MSTVSPYALLLSHNPISTSTEKSIVDILRTTHHCRSRDMSLLDEKPTGGAFLHDMTTTGSASIHYEKRLTRLLLHNPTQHH